MCSSLVNDTKIIGLIFSDLAILSSSVAKETEFDFWGFIFVTLAAVMSGFRWSMTQILLQVSLLISFIQFFLQILSTSFFSLFYFFYAPGLMISFLYVHVDFDISRKILMVCKLCFILECQFQQQGRSIRPCRHFNTSAYLIIQFICLCVPAKPFPKPSLSWLFLPTNWECFRKLGT